MREHRFLIGLVTCFLSAFVITVLLLIRSHQTLTAPKANTVPEKVAQMIDFNFAQYVQEEYGEVLNKETLYEEYYVEFVISNEGAEIVKQWAKEHANASVNDHLIYNAQDHRLKHNPSHLNVDYIYLHERDPENAKSTEATVYCCTDENGTVYLYVFA